MHNLDIDDLQRNDVFYNYYYFILYNNFIFASIRRTANGTFQSTSYSRILLDGQNVQINCERSLAVSLFFERVIVVNSSKNKLFVLGKEKQK